VARRVSGRVLLAAAVLATLTTALPASASSTTSADVPTRRAQSTTVVRTTTADTLVQVNVDLGMQVQAGRRCRSSLPGVCTGGNVYHPCFNLHDRAYAGCQMYTLFRVLDAGTALDLAQGIEIPSVSTARDNTLVEHGWGGKVTQVDLEIYAFDPLGRYGDARMRVGSFPHVLGDTASSDQIGHIRLPRLGAPDAGVLVGRALGTDGKPMPPRSFKLDAFGHENTRHTTSLVKGKSFELIGFGGAKIQDGVTDGTFRSKPLWTGAYDIHVQRKGASFRCGFDVVPGEVRFDLDFRKNNLGNPRCKPMRPLAQGVPG
jgi:hypothetical protein